VTLVFPALEDVPDSVGGALPVEGRLLDELEEREAILGFLATTGSQPSRCGGERSEVGAFEAAVQGASERRVRDDDQLLVGDICVELVDWLRALKWHAAANGCQ